MRLLDSYTTEEINELDNLMAKPVDERTDEEQAAIDEFLDAAQVAQMVEAARAEAISNAANERVTASLTAMENALTNYAAMYDAAIARLEAANNG